MEKKRTQRIIGILVIVALVIIVIPLLFGKSDAPMQETASIKAPPFPDQQQAIPDTLTTAENVVENAAPPKSDENAAVKNTIDPPAIPTEKIAATEPPASAAVNVAAESTPVTNNAAAADLSANTTAVSTTTSSETTANAIEVTPEIAKDLNTKEASIIYERPESSTAKTEKTTEVSSNTVTEPATVEVEKIDIQSIPTLKKKPAVIKDKSHKAKQVKAIFAKNKNTAELNKLKTAWAIQMGSFKVKQNAINLANKLRASGYKAFTRDIKSNGQVSTRVYIGPEFKQASAARLSSDVQHHLSLHGFVIPYKPLEI